MNESLDLSRSAKSYAPDQKRPRGKICTLCDRKFHINKILCNSFKAIDAQNMTLDSIKKQCDTRSKALNEEQQSHEEALSGQHM